MGDLFRKRLQHARAAIEAFTRTYCGLASDTAVCGCHRRVPAALRLGRVNPEAIDFGQRPSSYRETRGLVGQAEQARWALQVHRASHPRLRRSTSHVASSSPSIPGKTHDDLLQSLATLADSAMTTRDERVGDDGYPCQSANIIKGETPQCDQALDAEPG